MESKTIPVAIHQKADRLVAEGRVTHIKGLVYEVRGDHDTYSVVLGYPQDATGRCSCPATTDICSHTLAAAIMWRVDRELFLETMLSQAIKRDPFAGL